MKSLALVFVLMASSISAVRSEDACCESKTVAIEEKLRDIDLRIALKKYEQIQTERSNAELQVILAESETGDRKEQAKQIDMLKQRIERLRMSASELRHELLAQYKEVAAISSK